MSSNFYHVFFNHCIPIYFSKSPLLSLPPIYSTSLFSPDYYIFSINSILSKPAYPLFSLSAPIPLLPYFLPNQYPPTSLNHPPSHSPQYIQHPSPSPSFLFNNITTIITKSSYPLFSLSALIPLPPSNPLYQHSPLLSLFPINIYPSSLIKNQHLHLSLLSN